MAAGGERRLGRRLRLRLCHDARAVPVYRQRLAEPSARLVPVERRARRRARAARIESRCSMESTASVTSDTTAA